MWGNNWGSNTDLIVQTEFAHDAAKESPISQVPNRFPCLSSYHGKGGFPDVSPRAVQCRVQPMDCSDYLEVLLLVLPVLRRNKQHVQWVDGKNVMYRIWMRATVAEYTAFDTICVPM